MSFEELGIGAVDLANAEKAFPLTANEIKSSQLSSLKRTLKMLVEKPIEEGHWDTEDDAAIELIAEKIEELEA